MGDELEDVVADQAEGVAGDRLREPGDVLVADFFVDIGREHPGGELGVVGLDVGRLRLRIDSSSSSWVVEPSARAEIIAGGDDHRVDAHQALGSRCGVNDLVEIDGFEQPLRFFTRMVVVVSTVVPCRRLRTVGPP